MIKDINTASTGTSPLVSVLMTSYNRERYIGSAIQSVLASTFKDFELIIVDDGSKDETVNIANAFAADDKRVRVYINEKNLGDYPNRNKAASYAKGKYIKYVDSDDYIYPWGLQVMVETMEQFPEAALGFCSMEQNFKKIFPFVLNPKEAYEYHYMGPGLFKRAPLSAIIRRDVFESYGGFKPIRMAGDFEMWQRLAQKCSIVLMPQGMVWYRCHDAQEVNDFSAFEQVYEDLKVAYLNSKDFPLGKEVAERIKSREKANNRRWMIRGLLKLDFKTAKIFYKNLRTYRIPSAFDID